MGKKLTINPWVKMWVDPRETIRAIVNYNPHFRFGVLSVIYGLPAMFHMAQNLSLGTQFPISVILIGALAFAFIFGMIGISVASALLFWTGKWLGGQASFLELRAAVSWANVTNLVPIFLWVILTIIYGSNIFIGQFMQNLIAQQDLATVFPFFFIQMVVAVWSLVILFKAIGEVQGFSAWKALLNALIPFIIVIGVVSLLVGIISSAMAVS